MRTHKVCNECGENKVVEDYYARQCKHTKKDGTISYYTYLKPICKSCWDKESRQWFRKNWLQHLVQQAKNRAKQKGIPFNITVDDIEVVKVCPYLGIELKQNLDAKGPSHNSPTIDRIVPEKGYVKGNVQLMSHKANAMKYNASIDELLYFANKIIELHSADEKVK